MNTTNNILLVRIPTQEVVNSLELRDYILESLAQGVLVLTEDASCEVMELPPLGNVEVREEIPAEAAPEPEHPAQVKVESEDTGAEKRVILQRLQAYRDSNGLGSLSAVSARTAHSKLERLSVEDLRGVLTGDRNLPVEDWRKIARALDRLEGKRASDG